MFDLYHLCVRGKILVSDNLRPCEPVYTLPSLQSGSNLTTREGWEIPETSTSSLGRTIVV